MTSEILAVADRRSPFVKERAALRAKWSPYTTYVAPHDRLPREKPVVETVVEPARPVPPVEVPTSLCDPSIAKVQAVFLDELWKANYRIGNPPRIYTRAELVCKARSRMYSWPRHVCMSLVRQITGVSYPKLGKIFGGCDHTSVQYAIKIAPQRMEQWPLLADVHAKVLAQFGVK